MASFGAAEMEALAASGARDRLLVYAVGQIPSYKTPPHIRLLAAKLEAVERGEIARLAVFMPPRHGKSNLVSEIFPAWYLGRRPEEQVMFTTYAQDLADGFGRKVRNAVADPRHTRSFPDSILSEDSQSAKKFNTTKGGVYYAVGAGGPVTGRGADLLIIDDPLKNREEADSKLIRDKLWDWYASTAYTRLMPGGAVVLVQTRWHEDDLAGRMLRGHEDWDVLNLPALAEANDPLHRLPGAALWSEQYDEHTLANIRATIGEREFTALYQQRPAPLEGALFRRQWIQRNRCPRAGFRIAMGVDLALSLKEGADYTAVVVIARDEFGKLYVLDAARERVDFPTALNMIRMMADKWKPTRIAIEQVAYQAVVVQELLRNTTLPIKGVTPDRDKMTRAQPIALRYEQGLVNHHDLPSWFEDELLAFPQAEHDDAVDALVYAYQAVMALAGQSQAPSSFEMTFESLDPEIG